LSKKTLEFIDSKKGYYVVSVKRNQPNLFNEIKRQTESNQAKSCLFEEASRGKNKIKSRTYELFEFADNSLNAIWPSIKQFVKVSRLRVDKNNKEHLEISYYITNSTKDIKFLSQSIRGHWYIENCLHWVKDMVFFEDKRKHNFDNIAKCKSTILNIVINILRKYDSKNIKATMLKLCNRIDKLVKLI
jgi:predicted transposase YbfD/YdcC